MNPLKLMIIIGTRPDAIKLAPVILAAQKQPEYFQVRVVRTSQHQEMLDQVMKQFNIKADVDLDIMCPDQDLVHITTAALRGLYDEMKNNVPDWVIVQGDTTTSFVGALAAFYNHIPVAHVEAGLRTGKRYLPFPEEINRQLISNLTELHFPPTETARQNLLHEGVDEFLIHITGNTSIDALFHILSGKGIQPNAEPTDKTSPTQLLITAHRRENQGLKMENICKAIAELVEKHPKLNVIFPMHLNPNVRKTVIPILSGKERIELVEPMGYAEFVLAMNRATLILTDSGGIQEEAPSLGKPVLVMRTETERPEAVSAGTAILVGTDRSSIVENVSRLLEDKKAYEAISRICNPFGDGNAAIKILAALR